MSRTLGSRSRWDYIVIGAGSAGCALVHELVSGRRDQKILLLEAGPTDSSPFIRLQSTAPRACINHEWGYWTEPDPSRNGLVERWRKGRVLGGTSSINSAIFVRGGASDFDRWAQLHGCGGAQGNWSSANVIPIFRELEHSDQQGALRGQSGPLYVSTVRRPHPITEAFVQSACAAGHAFNPDYNGGSQEGVAYAQLTQRRGWRCSAADAFLRPVRSSKNLVVLTGAIVEKLHLAGDKANAVSFLHKGKKHKEAAQNIVLCAGAINSPKILMLSGIGEAQELKRHNIGVAVDLPGVGQNMREHPLTRLTFRTKIETYNLTGGWKQKLSIAAKFLVSGEGPIANVFESVAFVRSSSELSYPDLQIHFVPIGYFTTSTGSFEVSPHASILLYVNKSHPLSRGRVRLASADPTDPPIVECRLLEDVSDVDALVRGIEIVREIVQRAPISNLIDQETHPGPIVTGRPALQEHVRSSTRTGNHTIGTCRMGTGADAVVGPDLRVRGVENLWVADASIMPDLISGNTNAACMMIGKKLGKQFVAAA